MELTKRQYEIILEELQYRKESLEEIGYEVYGKELKETEELINIIKNSED